MPGGQCPGAATPGAHVRCDREGPWTARSGAIIRYLLKRPWQRQAVSPALAKSLLLRWKLPGGLLAKYKYPPDKQESAVALVMQQAELFAAELVA